MRSIINRPECGAAREREREENSRRSLSDKCLINAIRENCGSQNSSLRNQKLFRIPNRASPSEMRRHFLLSVFVAFKLFSQIAHITSPPENASDFKRFGIQMAAQNTRKETIQNQDTKRHSFAVRSFNAEGGRREEARRMGFVTYTTA